MPQFLKTIKNDMIKYGRNPTRYERLRVSNLETFASPGVKTVRFKARIQSESTPSIGYLTQVSFHGISFLDKKDKKHTELTSVDGKPVYFKKPNISTNPVFLKCSCEDFRFTWEYPASLKQTLIGNWQRYTRVTPPIPRPKNAKNPNPLGRDFVNPGNYLGYCKHVNSLLLSLRDCERLSPITDNDCEIKGTPKSTKSMYKRKS